MNAKELKLKFEAKVKELDEEMEVVNAKLDAAQIDSAEYNALIEKSMDIMRQTNRYLRAMGASEDQMYDL